VFDQFLDIDSLEVIIDLLKLMRMSWGYLLQKSTFDLIWFHRTHDLRLQVIVDGLITRREMDCSSGGYAESLVYVREKWYTNRSTLKMS
jgi:hypothetical protein